MSEDRPGSATPAPGIGGSALYRQEALDRLAAPGRRLERVRPVRPRDAAGLAAVAALVALALAWSVVGKVRVTVEGAGILLYPPALSAAGASPGDLLASTAEPALAQQRRQLLNRLTAATQRETARGTVHDQELALQRESLERQLEEAQERISTLEALASSQESSAAKVAAERRRDLTAREERANAVVERCQRDLASAEDLARSGAMSTADVTEASAAALQAEGELDAIRQQLAALPLEQVEAARQHDGLLRDLADARAAKDAVSTQLLALQRAEIERNADTQAEMAGLRDQLDAVDLALKLRRASEPDADGGEPPALADDELLVAVFMDAAGAKRVSAGMEIRVSPDAVERERYGSALGQVVEVSTYPVTPEQAEALLGNATLAETLTGEGRAVLVLAVLDRAEDTPTGYRWTTSRGPPGRLSPGSTLTAEVTVERRRPVTWLLPAIRWMTGAGT